MEAAQGILTVRGDMTSHAAVVARGIPNHTRTPTRFKIKFIGNIAENSLKI